MKKFLVAFTALWAVVLPGWLALKAQAPLPSLAAFAGYTTPSDFADIVPVIDPLKVGAIVENKGAGCTPAPIDTGTGFVAFNLATGSTNYCTSHTQAVAGYTITGCQGPLTSFNWWVSSDGIPHADVTAAWAAANINFQNGIPPSLSIGTATTLDLVSFKTKNSCASWQASIAVNFLGGP